MQAAATNPATLATAATCPSPWEAPGYELQEVLGSGGYGTVVRARQLRTGASVAIKFVKLQEGSRRVERFHRETALCAALHHPHIVPLLDKGEHAGHVYGVFAYVPGETLGSLIRRRGPLSAPEAGRLMAEVLDALGCAHAAGIVHRDLKPDNVMVASTGALLHAMVLDFGIGTVIPHRPGPPLVALTLDNESLGTPAYSAPEQLRGEPPSTRSDLYAWGLMFLECLTGAAAVQGASAAEILHLQLSPQEVPLPTEVAAHPIAALLRKALKKKVAERSVSAAALLGELTRIRLDDLVGVLTPAAQAQQYALTRTVATTRLFSEMRQLTVLCCSVSVWPETDAENPDVHRVDIEGIELLQRDELALFAETATRRGGLLSGTLGDRMIVLFGYPHASDADARLAAMAVQELMALGRCRSAALAQMHGVRIGLRMGMHTGMAVVAGGEVPSGHAVAVAMRLEALADTGTLVASDSSQRLLSRYARFEKAGSVGVPGQSADMQTYRLQGDPPVRLSDETTAAVAVAPPAPPCIGREPELQRLRAAWAEARTDGGIVMIRGEPGIGKSCLADWLRRHASEQGARTVGVQCQPEHRNTALSPFLDLVRQSLDATPPEARRAQLRSDLRAAGCDADAALPIFCTWLALPPGDGEPSRISAPMQKTLMLRSAAQWLLHRAESAPLLLVVEDVHWADPTSVELMVRLAALLPRRPVLLVMTARPPWSLPPGLHAECVELRRLDDVQAAALAVQTLAPHKTSTAVICNLVDRTDGVPLFIQEMARMLLDAYLVEQDGVWVFPGAAQTAAIPLTLRDSLVSRFDRIGPQKHLLQLAATIGRQFDAELLCACAGRPRSAIDADLAVLCEAALIVPHTRPGVFLFRHALIRDTAYECLMSAQRRRFHRDVAQTLMQRYPQRVGEEPAGVAHHWAGAGEHALAVRYAVRQLRITQLRALHDETIAYAGHIESWVGQLEAIAQRQARLDVNGYVIQAMMNRHGWAHPQVVERIALSQQLLAESVAQDKQVQHLWTLITYHHVASNRAEVRGLIPRLLDHAAQRQDSGVFVAAQTYQGLAHYSDGRFDLAERALTEAIDRYRPEAHAHHASEFGFDTRVWATAGRALVRWLAGCGTAARADAADAVRFAREIAHIPSLSMALLYQALGHQARGDKPGALATTDELLEITARYGLPAFTGYAEIIRCWAGGDMADIARADEAVLALWDMGCRYCQSYYRSFAAETLATHRRWPEAVERIDECLRLAELLDERLHSAELHLKKARYLRAMGADTAVVQVCLAQAVRTAHAAGKHRTETEALAALQAVAPAGQDVVGRLRELAVLRPAMSVHAIACASFLTQG